MRCLHCTTIGDKSQTKYKNFFKNHAKNSTLTLDKPEKIRYNDVYDCEKEYAVRKMGAYET